MEESIEISNGVNQETNKKTALISAVTGQDGSYLAEFLLSKGYEVHGIIRRASTFNTSRIEHFYQDPHVKDRRLFLHYGDLTDSTNLIRLIQEIQPDEIYNLAAQSHVQVSFETPEYTANADALGVLRILETIKLLGLSNKTKFYQASTPELYGKVQEIPKEYQQFGTFFGHGQNRVRSDINEHRNWALIFLQPLSKFLLLFVLSFQQLFLPFSSFFEKVCITTFLRS